MKLKLTNSIYIIFSLSLMCYFCSCETGTYVQGKTLYEFHCESCHMADGSGLAKLIPPLQSDYYDDNYNKLSCIIRNGLNERIIVNGKPYEQEMPYNLGLSDFEIVNIINYMDNVLLKKDRYKSLQSVRDELAGCTY